MNRYGQYCPIARAAEILGDRWTLLIVRDLMVSPRHFNALERGLPGIPRALLADRLKRLHRAGLIDRINDPGGNKIRYSLSQAGLELIPLMEGLTQWGAKWAFGEPEEAELNPVLLMWWMHDRVNSDRVPPERVVVEFDFLESRPARFWLVLNPGDTSVCVTHPGYEIDLLVKAELSAMYQVWLGRLQFADALSQDRIELEGIPSLTRGFPTWFALSPVVGILGRANAYPPG